MYKLFGRFAGGGFRCSSALCLSFFSFFFLLFFLYKAFIIAYFLTKMLMNNVYMKKNDVKGGDFPKKKKETNKNKSIKGTQQLRRIDWLRYKIKPLPRVCLLYGSLWSADLASCCRHAVLTVTTRTHVLYTAAGWCCSGGCCCCCCGCCRWRGWCCCSARLSLSYHDHCSYRAGDILSSHNDNNENQTNKIVLLIRNWPDSLSTHTDHVPLLYHSTSRCSAACQRQKRYQLIIIFF